MSKPRILIQLDTDFHASVFDAVVAVDSAIDQLIQYGAVEPTQVRELVHGAIFTRGPSDLKNTAIFIGGSNVMLGDAILEQVESSFFGPMRVSVMMDSNGSNTTAAAAVLAAARHVDLQGARATVLAATGPVGQRAVRLLARAGASVRVASRTSARAEKVCDDVQRVYDNASCEPLQTVSDQQTRQALQDCDVLIAAGAAGVQLVSQSQLGDAKQLKVAIDLNAVPPEGIDGIDVQAKAEEKDGVACYGAIGVGGTKMKIHKAAVKALFESNDKIFHVEEIFQLGQELGL